MYVLKNKKTSLICCRFLLLALYHFMGQFGHFLRKKIVFMDQFFDSHGMPKGNNDKKRIADFFPLIFEPPSVQKRKVKVIEATSVDCMLCRVYSTKHL